MEFMTLYIYEIYYKIIDECQFLKKVETFARFVNKAKKF